MGAVVVMAEVAVFMVAEAAFTAAGAVSMVVVEAATFTGSAAEE